MTKIISAGDTCKERCRAVAERVSGRLVVKVGFCEEETSEQGLKERRSQPEDMGKGVQSRTNSKCKGPGAGTCLRCSRTERGPLRTPTPSLLEEGPHADPLTPTHVYTCSHGSTSGPLPRSSRDPF